MSRPRRLAQALQGLIVKCRRARGIALVAQDIGKRGHVAQRVGVFRTKSAFAFSKPSASQLFGFFELARFSQGARQIFHCGKCVRMAVT